MSFKKISLYNAPGMRGECDEHLSDVMDSLGYKESFKLIDAKLVLGYSSVILAGLMYYAEKTFKNDFHNATYVLYLQLLVGGFFLMQFLWFIFNKVVEKDIKYVGYKNKKCVKISTNIKSKTDPVYNVTINVDCEDYLLSIPFNELFYEDGFLSMSEFTGKIGTFMKDVSKSK